MNLFARIGSAWGTLVGKAAPPGNYGAGWGGGPWFSDAFRARRAPTPHELVDAYKSLVYACVNLNANAVARLPLRLYATTRRGQPRPRCEVKSVSRAAQQRLSQLGYAAKAMAHAERVEEVTEHPLLDAVMRVNDDLDHAQLLTYTVMSLDIVGSAYWWPSPGRHRLPEEIWALPPHLVWPQFTSGSMVPDSYTFGGVSYPKDSLIRFRRLSARNPYGQGHGPEQAAIEYARLEDTFVSIQDDMLSNGPRPSVIVSHKDPKGTFGTAERSRLEADMNRKGRGGRAGAAFVVDGPVAVTPISYTPMDLGTKELSLYDLERIANCFDVPVSMLRTEDVNRANAEAGLEQHGRNAVEPRCKLIASALTRWTRSLDATGARGWDRLLWAFDPAVSADRRAEAELHRTYVSLGLPLNVALTEAGYDAVAGGDVPLVPGGVTPLSSLVGGKSGTDRRPPAREPGPSQEEAASGEVIEGAEARPLVIEAKNCGTGAGGFQFGNTCARGRGGSASEPDSRERRGRQRRDGDDRRSNETVPSMSDARRRRAARNGVSGPAPGSNSARDDGASLRDAALDVAGVGLDIAGIFDPSPTSDLASAGLSLYRREFFGAFLSLLGTLPALGDLAKAAKIPGYVKKVRNAMRVAEKSGYVAKILPSVRTLGAVLKRSEGSLRKLPKRFSEPLISLRKDIDDFVKRAGDRPKIRLEASPKTPAKPNPVPTVKPPAKPEAAAATNPKTRLEASGQGGSKRKPQADDPGSKPPKGRQGEPAATGKPAPGNEPAGPRADKPGAESRPNTPGKTPKFSIEVRTPDGHCGLGKHKEIRRKVRDAESHHGVMSKWMKEHFPGYNVDLAPAVLMDRAHHNATRSVFNTWCAEIKRQRGGTFDWSKVTEAEMRGLSERMFDAAKVPPQVSEAYWVTFEQILIAIKRSPPR